MVSAHVRDPCCYYYVLITNFVYLAGKMAIIIVMLYYIQTDYYEPWGDVTCPHIESLTTFWLIWNYILLSTNFIYFLIFFCSSFCDNYAYKDDFGRYE